ncbi:sensor histidine kinase [Blautia pseudococcoides]|uniref:histidine kinase n=1 Tax=Blautia pseudococcoides TaxID=1796616 RepID=A0A1C7IEQ4_9FIRM|nr:sensor histidine kinase [Blautia pseudococcoides]ANU78160.1 sensor histidine kinase [Blautia pseudococcoides]ASU30969.1 sensor histidine kinase [Blautia pseudococcoides]QQQ91499.1 sensor histidine kinase [Blautia pseudococcoides]
MISYIGLLKREKTVNPKIEEYVDVLDKKTQRLKILMEDLIEVSKINSGNFHIQPEQMDYQEFQQQVQGEFFEQLESRGLETVSSMPKERVYIRADGRALWRVMENLYGNIVKYALPGSRVYTDMRIEEGKVAFSLKNISRQPLNIDAEELTQRFIQGDESRSTEGSGLGLSIARNLVELMGGRFVIYLDGDLFKTTLIFPIASAGSGKNMEK